MTYMHRLDRNEFTDRRIPRMRDIQQWVKERNEALFSLDRARIEAFFGNDELDVPTDDIVFWAGVYKAICAITSAPPELTRKAKTWLLAHGMSPSF